jgi:hypothetical protein
MSKGWGRGSAWYRGGVCLGPHEGDRRRRSFNPYRPSAADLAFRTMSFAKIVIRQHIDIRIDLSKQRANFGGS